MRAEVEGCRQVWTEAKLEALPEDGNVHELVNGELVMSPKNNLQHENIFIDPETKRVKICHSLDQRQRIDSDGVLNGEPLLAGLSCPVADLFRGWNWE